MPFVSKTSILITGGTGSFGKAFVSSLLVRFPDIQRIVIYSRDELKQWELRQVFPDKQFPNFASSLVMCATGTGCCEPWKVLIL